MSDLPRPLRDPALLAAVRALDAQFGPDQNGSLRIEIHYRSGEPAKAKTSTEHEMRLTGDGKQA